MLPARTGRCRTLALDRAQGAHRPRFQRASSRPRRPLSRHAAALRFSMTAAHRSCRRRPTGILEVRSSSSPTSRLHRSTVFQRPSASSGEASRPRAHGSTIRRDSSTSCSTPRTTRSLDSPTRSSPVGRREPAGSRTGTSPSSSGRGSPSATSNGTADAARSRSYPHMDTAACKETTSSSAGAAAAPSSRSACTPGSVHRNRLRPSNDRRIVAIQLELTRGVRRPRRYLASVGLHWNEFRAPATTTQRPRYVLHRSFAAGIRARSAVVSG
jgi:hypothetical protein